MKKIMKKIIFGFSFIGILFGTSIVATRNTSRIFNNYKISYNKQSKISLNKQHVMAPVAMPHAIGDDEVEVSIKYKEIVPSGTSPYRWYSTSDSRFETHSYDEEGYRNTWISNASDSILSSKGTIYADDNDVGEAKVTNRTYTFSKPVPINSTETFFMCFQEGTTWETSKSETWFSLIDMSDLRTKFLNLTNVKFNSCKLKIISMNVHHFSTDDSGYNNTSIVVSRLTNLRFTFIVDFVK